MAAAAIPRLSEDFFVRCWSLRQMTRLGVYLLLRLLSHLLEVLACGALILL
jgi:hypothetical protein